MVLLAMPRAEGARRGLWLCSMPLILPVGERLWTKAAADLIDGNEPGNNDRKCKAREYGFEAEAGQVAPVAMKGVPGFKKEDGENWPKSKGRSD